MQRFNSESLALPPGVFPSLNGGAPTCADGTPYITPPPGVKWKLQRCQDWGNKGKCKRGNRCEFAHSDKELAPKAYKQQLKRLEQASVDGCPVCL